MLHIFYFLLTLILLNIVSFILSAYRLHLTGLSLVCLLKILWKFFTFFNLNINIYNIILNIIFFLSITFYLSFVYRFFFFNRIKINQLNKDIKRHKEINDNSVGLIEEERKKYYLKQTLLLIFLSILFFFLSYIFFFDLLFDINQYYTLNDMSKSFLLRYIL